VPGGVSSLTTLYVSGDLIIDTNTLYVDSTNNRVGIGTTSPANKLSISNNGNAAVAFRINDTNANASFLSFNASNTDAALIAGGTSAIPFDIYTGGVPRLRVSSNGNVGIGTSIVPYKLVVNSNSVGVIANITDGIAETLQISSGSGYISFLNPNSGVIAFRDSTNTTERMRITSGGNAQIGGTTGSESRLYVKSATSNTLTNAILIHNSSSADLFYVRSDGYTNFGLAGSSPYNYNTTFSPRTAGLDASGGFGYIVSTRESKGNIQSLKSIDYLNQLNPVSFNYRKKDSENKEFIDDLYEDVYFGFVADEVEKVNKDLVFYDNMPYGTKKLAGVHYNSVIAILTKAVQELKAELDQIKNK
jgi:hypothetical protein